jgi:hypothetical protein
MDDFDVSALCMGAEFLDGGMSSTSSDLDTQVPAPNFDSTPAMSASWELELALIDVDYDFYYENTISPQAFDDFDFTEFAKMPGLAVHNPGSDTPYSESHT